VTAENEGPIPAARNARDDDPRGDPLFRVAALAGVATLPLALIAGTIAEPTARADVNPGSSDAELLDVTTGPDRTTSSMRIRCGCRLHFEHLRVLTERAQSMRHTGRRV
jgi:hypothetical protein